MLGDGSGHCREMSLAGRIFYHLWHRPTGAIRESYRHGGPWVQYAAARARGEMIAAAATLPPLPVCPGEPRRVHFLTGRRFAYQTAFCLHSLAKHCRAPIAPEFYDDGTLDSSSGKLLLGLTPSAAIHSAAGLRARLDEFLPASRYPVLRERWLNYPHLRKIVDVHLGRSGWRLVLDSDLLFWREPNFLIDWLLSPDRPLYATDCEENYGYPRGSLEKIAGCPVPPRVNVGLCGLQSETIDWEYLEQASATLIGQHGTNYYLEQALVALLVARHPTPCAVAPAADYLTYPNSTEISAPTAVMHHYVDLSRDGYHRRAWRALLIDKT